MHVLHTISKADDVQGTAAIYIGVYSEILLQQEVHVSVAVMPVPFSKKSRTAKLPWRTDPQ
jgi:hypothetical protein